MRDLSFFLVAASVSLVGAGTRLENLQNNTTLGF
jgi:hypothetical protein